MDFQFCRNCETANPAFARFCENCGGDLLAEAEPEVVALTDANKSNAPRRTMDRRLYIGVYLLIAVVSLVVVRAAGKSASGYALLAVGLLYAAFHLTFIRNMWSALADGVTSITPGKAVGLHFVPLLNLLWAGFVILAFPGAYNDFIKRRGVAARALSSGVYFAYFVLLMLVFLGYFVPAFTYLIYIQPFFYIAVVYATCGAVNRLAESAEAVRAKSDAIFGFDLMTK